MKIPALQPIRYSARQCALMIQVALLYAPNSIMDSTGISRRQVNAMAAQRIAPTKAVLDYFRLTVDGEEYVWNPALEWKNDPCWGPVFNPPSDAVICNGAAIYLAVETVESSFVDR